MKKLNKIILISFCTLLVGVASSCNSLQDNVEKIRLEHPNCEMRITSGDEYIILNDTLNNRYIITRNNGSGTLYYYTNSN